MKRDRLAPFKKLLTDATNERAISFPRDGDWDQLSGRLLGDFGNFDSGNQRPPGGIGGGGGGGQSGGNPPGGGMDPWQTSVESRLTSLDGRLGRIEDKVETTGRDMATLTERVAHLPSKSYIGVGLIALLGGVAALTAFADRIQALVN